MLGTTHSCVLYINTEIFLFFKTHMCVEGTGTERRKQGGVIRDEEKNSMRSDGVLEERSIAWLELV